MGKRKASGPVYPPSDAPAALSSDEVIRLSPSQFALRTSDFALYCECIQVIKDYENDTTLSYLSQRPSYVLEEVHNLLPQGRPYLPKALREWAHGAAFRGQREAEFAADLCAIPDELFKDEVDHAEDIPVSEYLQFLIPAYGHIQSFARFDKRETGEADTRAPIDSLIESFGADQFSQSLDVEAEPRVIFRRERSLHLCKLFDISHGVPNALPTARTNVDSMLLLLPSREQWFRISRATADLPFAAKRELRWQEDPVAHFSTILLSVEHTGNPPITDQIVYSLATNQRHRQAIGLPSNVQYGLACDEGHTHVIASFLDAAGDKITLVKVAVIHHTQLVDLLRFCHFLDAIRRRGHIEALQLAERLAQPTSVPLNRYWRHRGLSVHQQVHAAEGRKKSRHASQNRPTASNARLRPNARQEANAALDHIHYMDPTLFILLSHLDSGELILSREEEESYQRALADLDDPGPPEGTSYRHAENPVQAWVENLRTPDVPARSMDNP